MQIAGWSGKSTMKCEIFDWLNKKTFMDRGIIILWNMQG
jgi:hypothetical protein